MKVIYLPSIVVTFLQIVHSVKIENEMGYQNRFPGLHGQDCSEIVIQTVEGTSEPIRWTLVEGYREAADKYCEDPCAYKDESGRMEGVYCLPRNKKGASCCAVSTNVTKDDDDNDNLSCKEKIKEFGVGDKHHIPGCEWGYDNEGMGPHKWSEWWPGCAGDRQSPINIEKPTDDWDTISRTISFKFEGFDLETKGHLYDNGHSLYYEDNAETSRDHKFSGGPFAEGETYYLKQMHWHWGKTDNDGSEHSVGGVQYAMELHLVCYNEKFDNLRSAVEAVEEGSVAVLGIFYEKSKEDNKGLNKLVEFIEKIANDPEDNGVDHPVDFKNGITIEEFLPFNIQDEDAKYYAYKGSFTTPPCSEPVDWIIFNQTNTISHRQLEIFRKLKTKDGKSLAGNFRPIQPTNDRPIKRYNF